MQIPQYEKPLVKARLFKDYSPQSQKTSLGLNRSSAGFYPSLLPPSLKQEIG